MTPDVQFSAFALQNSTLNLLALILTTAAKFFGFAMQRKPEDYFNAKE
jgi:hypothetical protein